MGINFNDNLGMNTNGEADFTQQIPSTMGDGAPACNGIPAGIPTLDMISLGLYEPLPPQQIIEEL